MNLDPTKMADWQIAEAAEANLRPVAELAGELGLAAGEWHAYGENLAKVDAAKVLRRVDLSSPVSDFLGNCVVIGILLFGSSMVLRGDTGLTSEFFVSYIMIFVLMIPPSKELTTAISQMKKGRACVDRLQQFLQEPETVVDAPDAKPFDGVHQQIEFRQSCRSLPSFSAQTVPHS